MDIYFFFQLTFTIFFGITGLIIGSFLNVCIYRIPEGRTVVKGHSMCMSCGHELGAPDLVPLFSWLFLKGKCRYCGAPIASRYAKIEGLTGLVFAGLAWQSREYFYLPGAPIEDVAGFLTLFILLTLAAVVIVSMMIQKDRGTGMYRLSAVIFGLAALRLALVVMVPATLPEVLLSMSQALLIAAAIIVFLLIPGIFEARSPRMFLADLFTGRSIKTYFGDQNRTARTSDLLFMAVCAAVGFPSAIVCLIIYAVFRTARNQESLMPYLGIIIAGSALVGIMFFP